MPFIHTEVEINCSPEQVRKTVSIHHLRSRRGSGNTNMPQFLDFPSYSSWPTTFIKSITLANPSNPLEPGARLNVELEGISMTPVLLTNSTEEFKWAGKLWNIPGLFNGNHYFKFTPSTKTPGATTFVQGEDFSGILSFMMAEGSSFWTSTKKGFEGFNQDLRKRCEAAQ